MDEKPLDLRDKIAIEIISGLLNSSSGPEKRTVHKMLLDHFYYFDTDQTNDPHSTTEDIEKICRYAYSIADIMRKVRLDTFQ